MKDPKSQFGNGNLFRINKEAEDDDFGDVMVQDIAIGLKPAECVDEGNLDDDLPGDKVSVAPSANKRMGSSFASGNLEKERLVMEGDTPRSARS